MSATSLILILLGVFLTNIVLTALIIRLATRLLQVEKMTFVRALLLVVVALIVNSVLAMGYFRVVTGPLVLLNLALFGAVVLFVQLVLTFLFLPPTPFGKVLATWGIWLVGSSVVGAGAVLLLRTTAEAFIVPTGAMADTILGYHKDVVCPKCGYAFSVNCSMEVEAPEGLRTPVMSCTCPNCREPISLTKEARDPRTGQLVEMPDLNKYPIQPGDRILTGKWLFGLNIAPPARFDVIVFEYPDAAEARQKPSEEGKTKPETIKYVERLIGLPEETIAIRDGKLYLLSADKGLRFNDGPPDDKKLWKYEHMHVDAKEAMKRWDKNEFQIVRKPPELVLTLRHIVYDNDHPAQDLADSPRWVAESGAKGWTADKLAHTVQHAAADESRLSWLRYQHVIGRDGRTKPELITDFMGYNSFAPPAHWVGDLMMECDVTIDKPQGKMVLELSRGISRYRAIFDLTTGECTLKQIEEHPGNEAPANDAGKELDKKPTELKKPGTYHVRLANVDDRLLLWIDGKLPFGDGVPYTPSEKTGPYRNDLQPASIGVRSGGVTIGKLQLWRDTYYTTMRGGDVAPPQDVYPTVDYANPDDWDRLQHLSPMTMYVQPGHYLALGDNSSHQRG